MSRRAGPTSRLLSPASPAPAGQRMAPASLGMNPVGLRTCSRDRAGSGPLPFSVKSLLQAEHWLGAEPAEPREERPRGAAEPRARVPAAAPLSSPRKCPVARLWAARGARPARARRTRAGRTLSLVTLESNQPLTRRPGCRERIQPTRAHPTPPARAQTHGGSPAPHQTGFCSTLGRSPQPKTWGFLSRSLSGGAPLLLPSLPAMVDFCLASALPAQVFRFSKWAEFPSSRGTQGHRSGEQNPSPQRPPSPRAVSPVPRFYYPGGLGVSCLT